LKIIIGTAQFGMRYGLLNKSAVSQSEIKKILQLSKNKNIKTIDTAISYGRSEFKLGEANVSKFKIISKLPSLINADNNIQDWVIKNIENSLKKLKIKSLEGLLFHDSKDFKSPKVSAALDALQYLKKIKKIKKIGVSIYCPTELSAINRKFMPDLVQAPFSIIDRRLENSGWLNWLKENDVEIHARSIFLQGLLLLDANHRPKKFLKYKKFWKEWDSWLLRRNLSPLQACIGFCNSNRLIDKFVIGIDNYKNLKEIISQSKFKIKDIPESLSQKDKEFINPSSWI
tara:strand:+ start:572 stop:1429 length:858 start_codon:yes stop_codon:yes gene_type:complete